MATRLLEAGGFDVVGEAADGQGALSAAHRLRPDVVLPDMSGFAVAEALADGSGQAAVVLVSSRSAGELAAGLERSRAHGFIAKRELTVAALCALVEGRR